MKFRSYNVHSKTPGHVSRSTVLLIFEFHLELDPHQAQWISEKKKEHIMW